MGSPDTHPTYPTHLTCPTYLPDPTYPTYPTGRCKIMAVASGRSIDLVRFAALIA